jgi:hypothetical protein
LPAQTDVLIVGAGPTGRKRPVEAVLTYQATRSLAMRS